MLHDVLAFVSRFAAQNREHDYLCNKRSGGIENHVVESASTRGEKALMPLIQTGNQRRAEQSDRCPLQAPWSAEPRKSSTPGAEKQDAHYGVTNNVPGLSEHVVPESDSGHLHSEEKMKNRIENPGRMSARAQVCGFKRNNCNPDNRGQPNLEDSFARGSQFSHSSNAKIASTFVRS